MKVVLFCGGFGTRMREHSDAIPKPLVDIGNRPIIWHLMRYYAHFGHKEFVLCLGYKGDMIKNYFLNYDSYSHRDFVMRDGGRHLEPAESDIADWTIHFVDTGLHAKGWSRQDVLDFMYANSAVSETRAVSEAERFMAIPSQALAYKIGQLKIREIRDNAEARLGDKFDVQAFHTEILKDGSLPLSMLESKLSRWVDSQL